jgi:hypothetical protein
MDLESIQGFDIADDGAADVDVACLDLRLDRTAVFDKEVGGRLDLPPKLDSLVITLPSRASRRSNAMESVYGRHVPTNLSRAAPVRC